MSGLCRGLLLCVLLLCGAAPQSASAKEAKSVMDILRRGEAARVRTYQLDGRAPIAELYQRQLELEERYRWKGEDIFTERAALEGGEEVLLPARCLTTPRRGPALWIITGIHGEEPAGPNALSANVHVLGALGEKGVPIVLMPLCNPLGYVRSWRYPNAAEYSETNPGCSVGDSDHLLLDEKGSPRLPAPVSRQCDALTRRVVELSRDYPPVLTLDLHEDDDLERGYLYSQGALGTGDPVAMRIVQMFVENEFPLYLTGKTRFGEEIVDGIISSVKDGSIDELLSAPRISVEGASCPGPSGRSVLVVETGSRGARLADRVKVHDRLLHMVEELWEIARKTHAGALPLQNAAGAQERL